MGYYPVSLFVGNQSVFSTLGDHAGHIGFSGEALTQDVDGRTSTDMGSGYFAEAGGPGLATCTIFAHRLGAMAVWPTTTAPLQQRFPVGTAMPSSVVPEPAKKLASRIRRVAVATARRLIPIFAAC